MIGMVVGMKKIDALQTLRAVAFMEIFLGHCELSPLLGSFGVSMFIVLSGFCMGLSYIPRTEALPNTIGGCVRFGAARVKKLYIFHVVMTFCAMLIRGVPTSLRELGILITNLLLLQSLSPDPNTYFAFNGVSWYLSTYMFICMAAPVVLRLAARTDTKKKCGVQMVIIAGIMAAVGVGAARVGYDFAKWVTYICPVYRVLDFSLGVLMGRMFLLNEGGANRSALAAGIGAVVWSALCTGLISQGSVGFVYNLMFVPSSLMLVWACANIGGTAEKLLTWRGFVHIGDLSGYMFLIHQCVIQAVLSATKQVYAAGLCASMTLLRLVWLLLSFVLTLLLAQLCARIAASRKLRVRA